MRFRHTLNTTATPEQIWRLWTDVEHWYIWDTELISASLFGEFALHTKGKLKPKKGFETGFVISQLEPQKSYTFTTQLPLCKLNVWRGLTVDENSTAFTHEVSFVGPLAFIFSFLLGHRFRSVLPTVMENLRQLAETQ